MGVRVHVDCRVQGGPAHSAEGELASAILAAVLAVGGGGGGGRGASSPAQRQGRRRMAHSTRQEQALAQVREHGIYGSLGFDQGDLLASLTIHASSCPPRQRLTALFERSQRLGWGYSFCAQCTVHVQVRV